MYEIGIVFVLEMDFGIGLTMPRVILRVHQNPLPEHKHSMYSPWTALYSNCLLCLYEKCCCIWETLQRSTPQNQAISEVSTCPLTLFFSTKQSLNLFTQCEQKSECQIEPKLIEWMEMFMWAMCHLVVIMFWILCKRYQTNVSKWIKLSWHFEFVFFRWI